MPILPAISEGQLSASEKQKEATEFLKAKLKALKQKQVTPWLAFSPRRSLPTHTSGCASL